MNIPKSISLCKWQDDIISFKFVQFVVKNTWLLLKASKQVEATVEKQTFNSLELFEGPQFIFYSKHWKIQMCFQYRMIE